MNLRNFFLPIISVFIFYRYGIGIPKYFLQYIILLCLYPTISFFIGFNNHFDIAVATSQYSTTILSLLMLLLLSRVPFDILFKSFVSGIFIVNILAVLIWIFLFFGVFQSYGLADLLIKSNAGFFGYRDFDGYIIPNVYFNSTLYTLPVLIYFIHTARYMLAAVPFMALIFGFSKTAIVFLLAFVLFKFYRFNKFISLSLIFTLLLGVYTYFEFDPYDAQNQSLYVRFLHISDVVEIFSQNLFNTLVGFGLGTSFFSNAFNDYVSNFELDHINSIRKYGFIWFTYFSFFVFKTIFLLFKKRKTNTTASVLWVMLLIQFIVAGSNPVLVNPLFFLLLFINTKFLSESDHNARTRRHSTCNLQRS